MHNNAVRPHRRFLRVAMVALASGLFSGCTDVPTGARAGDARFGTDPTPFQLPGITATGCQWGGEYPNCKPQPTTPGDAGVSPTPGTDPAAPSSGGGGGGGSTTNDPTSPPDSTDGGINECQPQNAGALSGGDDVPAECEDEASTACPFLLSGKVITAGIVVAGMLHTFKFEGPMTRSSLPNSPAKYAIKPTVSEDAWWVAEAAWISVNCLGVFIPIGGGERIWVGQASYAGTNDVHMVMGPGNPSF